MEANELKEVLDKHKKWLNGEVGGERANLSRANLYRANLSGANLSGADLYRADLSRADLSGANLSGANLYGANLSRANLSRADLSRANLYRANLSGANLSGADLYRADLSRADLSGANLSGANLYRAENVNTVNWDELTAFYGLICPEEGAFIGWKKAYGMIVKLRITEDSKRSSATSRKCRCSKAEVLEIQCLDGSVSDVKSVPSDRSDSFLYTVGETVEVPDFDDDRWNECSRGIHFFITRAEAVNYGR